MNPNSAQLIPTISFTVSTYFINAVNVGRKVPTHIKMVSFEDETTVYVSSFEEFEAWQQLYRELQEK
jgi:hypothetical protein